MDEPGKNRSQVRPQTQSQLSVIAVSNPGKASSLYSCIPGKSRLERREQVDGEEESQHSDWTWQRSGGDLAEGKSRTLPALGHQRGISRGRHVCLARGTALDCATGSRFRWESHSLKRMRPVRECTMGYCQSRARTRTPKTETTQVPTAIHDSITKVVPTSNV